MFDGTLIKEGHGVQHCVSVGLGHCALCWFSVAGILSKNVCCKLCWLYALGTTGKRGCCELCWGSEG